MYKLQIDLTAVTFFSEFLNIFESISLPLRVPTNAWSRSFLRAYVFENRNHKLFQIPFQKCHLILPNFFVKLIQVKVLCSLTYFMKVEIIHNICLCIIFFGRLNRRKCLSFPESLPIHHLVIGWRRNTKRIKDYTLNLN